MTFDLSAALEALTQRMQTNPSEFFEDTYRWNFIMQAGFKESLSEDEIKLLVEGLIYVRRAEINNRILQGLLNEPQPEYEKVQYSMQGTTAVNMGMQHSAMNAASPIFKSQLEVNQMQNIAQNTPSQYLKSFFK